MGMAVFVARVFDRLLAYFCCVVQSIFFSTVQIRVIFKENKGMSLRGRSWFLPEVIPVLGEIASPPASRNKIGGSQRHPAIRCTVENQFS